jgi:hypothetical protein
VTSYRPGRPVPAPRLGCLAFAEGLQGTRIGPVDADVLGLARIGDLESLTGQQGCSQRPCVDVVDGRSRTEVDLGRAAVEACDAGCPEPMTRCGITMIWSSPPTTARIPRICGSAKAALMSAARATGVAPTSRVVGYSTGMRLVTSVSRRIACSCNSGKAPAAANDGERTAIRSPGRAFGGWTGSYAIPEIQTQSHASLLDRTGQAVHEEALE